MRASAVKAALAAVLVVCAGWLISAHAARNSNGTQDTQARLESSQLTESERAQSQQWGLSEGEWQRFKTLMQGIRGRLSPNISPIEALGIDARTDDERKRYAEMWAKALREDTERVLAFQHAYDDAWTRLYGNEPLIDLARLPPRPSATRLQPGDRILLFAASNCAACGPVLDNLLAKVQSTPKLGLDIYLIDSGNDDAKVRSWATEHGVPPALVRARTVTLNHDGGMLGRMPDYTGTVPYVVRRRGTQLLRIEPPISGSR